MSWIGDADLRAAEKSEKVDVGPIAQALGARTYDRVLLLADRGRDKVRRFEAWIWGKTGRASLIIEHVELTSPTNFEQIYRAVTSTLDNYLKQFSVAPRLTFHISPGTPAMGAIWVILGKTRYPAEIIQSSKQKGVETASLPFDIFLSPEFVTDVLRAPDRELEKLSRGVAPETGQFGDIFYKGAAMRSVIERAKRIAPRSIPVLIQGDSGTGKELLARAIYAESTRKNKPFVIVNCGAIPSELVESELFGHKKGSFTNAIADHVGFFEAADGGTLFLDEIGELPLQHQVKLLRAVQQGEVRRIGSSKSSTVDVRIIAATNRDLVEEVREGRFREDLFYRLAVEVLPVPPLRERDSDIGPLIDLLMSRINDKSEAAREPGFKRKKLSADAKKLLMQQSWPGNIRELENTLTRAAVSSDEGVINAEDLVFFSASTSVRGENILNRSLEQAVDLQQLIGTVAQHYLRRAMEAAHGNKSRAAEILGLPSYQTLTNWMERHGVADDWHGSRK